MGKTKVHNEWFRRVSLGNKASCPNCHQKLEENEHLWSWGEYVSGRWYTVKHFCKVCFGIDVQQALIAHAKPCGCSFQLVGYQGMTLPSWLTLEAA